MRDPERREQDQARLMIRGTAGPTPPKPTRVIVESANRMTIAIVATCISRGSAPGRSERDEHDRALQADRHEPRPLLVGRRHLEHHRDRDQAEDAEEALARPAETHSGSRSDRASATGQPRGRSPVSRAPGHNRHPMRELIITADDYGLSERYDEGILEAARAGAIDAVSAFATRTATGPEALLATGIEVGLHLDLGSGAEAGRASMAERRQAAAAIAEQLEAFASMFGRPPAYLDGHHHGHARDGLGVLVSEIAVAHDLPVRSVSPRHTAAAALPRRGDAGPAGRQARGAQPALPAELSPPGSGGCPRSMRRRMDGPPGKVRPRGGLWLRRGPRAGPGAAARFAAPPGIRRTTHAEALAGA